MGPWSRQRGVIWRLAAPPLADDGCALPPCARMPSGMRARLLYRLPLSQTPMLAPASVGVWSFLHASPPPNPLHRWRGHLCGASSAMVELRCHAGSCSAGGVAVPRRRWWSSVVMPVRAVPGELLCLLGHGGGFGVMAAACCKFGRTSNVTSGAGKWRHLSAVYIAL
jgi:hypothetical protein